MKLLSELTESRLVVSKSGYKKYSGKDLAEILYLHILAFRILSCEDSEKSFIFNYSFKTKRHGSFKKWTQHNTTDLYLFLFPLFNNDVELRNKAAEEHIARLTLDEKLLMDWIRAVYSKTIFADIYARRLFIRLDRQLMMERLTHRSIRRLAMNWPDLNRREKQLAVTRLLHIMRSRCNSSDLLPRLELLAKNQKLELKNSTDPDDKTPTLSQAAARYRLKEEDGGGGGGDFGGDIGGGGTTSSDISPMVTPWWGVYRRAPAVSSSPKKRKRKRKKRTK